MPTTPDQFLIIGLTRPYFFEGEAQRIVHLLTEGGLTYVHLRKPGATPEAVEALALQIPPELRHRLTVHYHFSVARSAGLGGVHLSASSPTPPHDWSGRVSRSCHRLAWPDDADLRTPPPTDDGTTWAVGDGVPTDYDFLSPIYDSISKEGYRSAFTPETLSIARRLGLIGRRTIALGGVTPDKLDELRLYGFGGAAMLGSLW